MNKTTYACLDCGNTRLKWGLWEGTLTGRETEGAWLVRGALSYENLTRLPSLLADGPQRPQHIVVANVAGAEVETRLNYALAAWSTKPRFLQAGIGAGVKSDDYDNAQLGVDRWCALIGARGLYPQRSCLIVSAGTATTVDALSSDGIFIGGLILPGVDMMRRALAEQTTHLPLAEGLYEAWPRSTVNAILSGGIEAVLGAIERAMRRLSARDSRARAPICLLTGGAAPSLLTHLPDARHVEHLELEGVLRLGRQLETKSEDH